MEDEQNIVVGVDIGSSKICAAAAAYNDDGNISLKGFVQKEIHPDSEFFHNGHVENVLSTRNLINELLEKLADDLKINLEEVNVNISNADISCNVHKGTHIKTDGNRQIQQDDIDKLVDDIRISYNNKADRSILHSLPLDFYVNDIEVRENIVGRTGVQLKGDFYFVTTPTDKLENLYTALREIKAKTDDVNKNPIEIEHLLVSPIADAYTLLNPKIDDRRNGAVIVNIGADLTEVSIYMKNSLRYYKTIPIAGNSITKDLSEAFNIGYEEAEKLKKVCSLLKPDDIAPNEVLIVEKLGLEPIEILTKNAFTVIEWRLKELAGIVKSELIKSGYDNKLVNGVIFTGGTSNIIWLREIFKDITKIRNSREYGISSQINVNGFHMLKKPQYSTLLGLLMVNGNNFDTRVSNKVLRSDAPIMKVAAQNSAAQKPKPKEAPKKGGFMNLFKGLNKSDEMNDNF